jgi:hypothetical protein
MRPHKRIKDPLSASLLRTDFTAKRERDRKTKTNGVRKQRRVKERIPEALPADPIKSTPSVKIAIDGPRFQAIKLRCDGTAPLLMHKFSQKMRKKMEEAQTRKDKTTNKREPKDYEAEFNAGRYVSSGGWDGVPTNMIRAALINACRYVHGLPMTQAKGIFSIISQGADKEDGTPLVKILSKAPAHDTRAVRNDGGGTDLRNRPRYYPWSMVFEIQFDADLVSAQDVANLLARAGAQVGIGELRPQARKGMGGDYGTFQVVKLKGGD